MATCRNPASANELCSLLSSLGLPPPIALDVDSDESVEAARKRVETEYGKLNVLVNNAGKPYLVHIGKAPQSAFTGIAPENHPLDPPGRINLKEMSRVLNTNVVGVCRVTQQFLPLLKESKPSRGKVVYISTAIASIGAFEQPADMTYTPTSYR